MKWKWLELCSVDVAVECGSNNISNNNNNSLAMKLYANGPDNVLVECTQRCLSSLYQTNISLYDSYRLKADMEDFVYSKYPEVNPPVIIEVTYHSLNGNWIYHHIRSDKKIPNSINTVFSVFMELCDNIDIMELEYTLLARTEEERDYIVQCDKMKGKALEFQRNRTKVPL